MAPASWAASPVPTLASDAQYRVPRAAPVARQVRRSAACVPGVHRLGLQPAPDQPRRIARSRAPIPGGPAIMPNYLSTQEDQTVAAAAMRLTRRIWRARARKVRTGGVQAGPQFQSDDELVRAAGDIGTTIFHPVGTCKMGRPPTRMPWSTRRLRVHGIDACASSTRRSCPRSRPATLTPEHHDCRKAAAMILAGA